MKKLLWLFLAIFGFTFSIISCSGDDEEVTNSNNSNSITLTTSHDSRFVNEEFTFTVKNAAGTDVTSSSTFTVNNIAIDGNVFSSAVSGSFSVKATHSGLTVEKVIFVNPVPVPLTNIVLNPNSLTISNGSNINFTVTGNNGATLTSNSTIYVNGTPISGNIFPTTSLGVITAYATYNNNGTLLTSPTVSIDVVNPTNFNKHVLIEDFTGTWCGYCPRVSYAISQVENQTNDAVIAAIHRGNDPYNFSGAGALETQIGLSGYPTAMLNRTTEWTYPENNNITQAVNLTTGTNPKLGLAINSSVSGSTANVEVKVKFGQNFTNLKLVVYAVEDNLIYNQTNYTSYYGGVSTIQGFEHDNVLRAVLSNSILGETITGSTDVNDEYTKSYTYTIPSNVNANNLKFIAFVVDSTKSAINSRVANANTSQTFETE